MFRHVLSAFEALHPAVQATELPLASATGTMSTQAASPAYGGRGPLLLGVSWAEAAVALILIALRAKTASLCPPGHLLSTGIFGLRWDFCWVIFALVSLSSTNIRA